MAEPTTPPRGVTGTHTTNGVPRGVTSITPYIGVPHAAEAADFYREVFDARVVERTIVNGTAVHVHLDLGDGHLHLEEPNPAGGLSGPPPDESVAYSFAFYCEDIDAVVRRALDAGAEELSPALTFASGDRFAAIRDPYGVRWSITSRVEDLSEAESAERIAAWVNRDQSQD